MMSANIRAQTLAEDQPIPWRLGGAMPQMEFLYMVCSQVARAVAISFLKTRSGK
jgi:hypothetical protein